MATRASAPCWFAHLCREHLLGISGYMAGTCVDCHQDRQRIGHPLRGAKSLRVLRLEGALPECLPQELDPLYVLQGTVGAGDLGSQSEADSLALAADPLGS